MNRVYPLREGSGECETLDGFDAGRPAEFRGRSEKISCQIISLNKTMYHLRHRLRRWLSRTASAARLRSAGSRPQRFRNTESDATLAPLVFGTLKFSYSRRAPIMLM